MKIDAPETTQGEGGFLNEPGTYHVVVTEVREGETHKGTPIDGITITMEVLAGTIESQAGKTKNESLFLPSQKDLAKEEQTGTPAMSKKKIAALYIATNQMQPSDLGKSIEVDDQLMIGQQFVVEFDEQKEMDGEGKYTVSTGNIQISYSDIFHVDDPSVKAVPKNADALGMIPVEQRHDEAWFAWTKKKPTHRKPVAAGSSASSVADDLF